MRDRGILTTLLYHGLRRAELCAQHLVDLQEHRGVRSLRVHGKGAKIRYVPLHPAAAGAIARYLEGAGHGADKAAALFQPVSNNTRGAGRAITPGGVYQMLAKYAAGVGIEVDGFGPHALRATAATNALEHNADIAKFNSGWDMPTSRPRASMIGVTYVPKTVPPSRSLIQGSRASSRAILVRTISASALTRRRLRLPSLSGFPRP